MIGTSIRSLRHLWRVCDDSLIPALVNFRNGDNELSHVLKIENNKHFRDSLVFFNRHNTNEYGEVGVSTYASNINGIREIIAANGYSRCYTILKENLTRFDSRESNSIGEIILLPKTFSADFNEFLKNNGKMFSNLSRKYGMDPNGLTSKMLYIYANGSKNFFLWAANLMFSQRVQMSTVRSILIWNDLYGQLTKDLSKGTITAYTNRESLDALMVELSTLRKNKRINDAINSFNTTQKKLLKNNELSKLDKETLAKFSKLTEIKKLNFIQKMSSIDDFDELMRQMRFTCSIHFSWNKDSFNDFLENVEGLKCKKIFENENSILIEVFDYETIKQLAKTTNWCISKNKSYWNNYVEQQSSNKQYMVFDFSKKEDDKLSIVGFTTNKNKGIINAHDFTNNDLMGNGGETALTTLKSYIAKFLERNNIYKVLAHCGIDISVIANYPNQPYSWDKESALNYLHECVNQENVDTLMSNGDKIVLSVKDENIKYFLGDGYIDHVPVEYHSYQHILFFDFSLSKYDSNRIRIAIIRNHQDEDTCFLFFDAQMREKRDFEMKLTEYNLPYDIIRRTDNVPNRLCDALLSYNMPMVNECMKTVDKHQLLDIINDYVGYEEMEHLLRVSIIQYVSFDYVNFIYDNGLTISQTIGYDMTRELCRSIINTIYEKNHILMFKLPLPEKEDIEYFYSETLGDIHSATYVGLYLILDKILKNEKFETESAYLSFVDPIIRLFKNKQKHGALSDDIMIKIGKNLNFKNSNSTTKRWLEYAMLKGGVELKEMAEKCCVVTKLESIF